tara:strand:+ start:1680 stop:3344 length:1665 start_codon:yes stop_codon:yes gene_type:complete
MPYTRDGKCVYKKNKDGSKGKKTGCSDSVAMAKQYLKALYAQENEANEGVDGEIVEFFDGLLVEARFKDVKAKYSQYMGMVDTARDQLGRKLGDKGVSKYILYVMKETHKMFDEPKNKVEVLDAGKDEIIAVMFDLIDLVEKFEKNISRIKEKDIYKLNASELENLVDKLPTPESEEKRKRKAQAEKESARLYDEDDILVVRPLTTAAATYYGMGTRWCISATQCKNYFDEYTADGKAFAMVILKNLQREGGTTFTKAAMVFNSEGEYEELYDAEDDKYYDTNDLRDAIALNHKRTGQNYFNDLDDEEQEEINDILREIMDRASGEISDNPPDASEVFYKKIAEYEEKYKDAIKHASYGAEVVDFGEKQGVQGYGSFEIKAPVSVLVKEPSYQEQMDLGDRIRDLLDNELRIYPDEFDVNIVGDEIVVDLHFQMYEYDVEEYDDLLERVYEADRKYSQMVQIMNTAFKEGGFIEAPQQDEVTEYLDSFAKNNQKVNIVDEVSSYLESLTDPDEDEDGDSNFNSDDEDFMKFDDISTEDILDPDKPAPWDRKKEA